MPRARLIILALPAVLLATVSFASYLPVPGFPVSWSITSTGNFTGIAIEPVSGDIIVGGRDERQDHFGINRLSRVFLFSQSGLQQGRVDFGDLGAGEEGIRCVKADSAGNVISAGSENVGIGEAWMIRKHSVLLSSQLWMRDSPGVTFFIESRVNAVDVDDSGIVAAGFENRPADGGVNWRVVKYDPNGTLLWSVSVAGGGTDVATAVGLDLAGNVYVAGSEDRSLTNRGLDWLVRKYDSAGTLVWSRSHNGVYGGDDIPRGLAVDSSGSVYVVGEEDRSDVYEGKNWLIVKYDPAGNILWSRSLNGSADGPDIARAVGVNAADGSVAVGGETSHTGQGLNWTISKYDSAGTFLFRIDSNSAVNGDDSVWGLAIDSGGNILAGGYREVMGEWITSNWRRRRAWVLRKYDSTGNPLWDADAPIDRRDSASALGMDFRNWAWVAGRDRRPGRGQDILIQVYSMTQTGRTISASMYDFSRGDEGPPSIYVGVSQCTGGSIRQSETLLNFSSAATIFVPSTQMTMLAIQGLFMGLTRVYNERLGPGQSVTGADVTRLGDNTRIALGTVNANGTDQLFVVMEKTSKSCQAQEHITATYWSGSSEAVYGRAGSGAAGGNYWAVAKQGGDLVLFKYSPTSFEGSGPTDLKAVLLAGFPHRFITTAADEPRAARVDTAGNLYVAGAVDLFGAIWKFTDAGVDYPGFPKSFALASPLSLSALTIDGGGNILAAGSAGAAAVLLGVDAEGNTLAGIEQPMLFYGSPDSLEATGVAVEPGGAVWIAGTLTAASSSSLWTGSMSVLYRFSYLPPPPSVAPGTVRLKTRGGAVLNLLRGGRLEILAHPTSGGTIHFQVMTMRGEPVWEYALHTPGNQTETFIWDGRNSAGRQVVSGAYAVRIKGAGLDEIMRAVVVKKR